MRHFPKCWWRKPKTALILLALVPSLAFAEPTLEELPAERDKWAKAAHELEQFQFFTGCKPIRFISHLPYHHDVIRALVENKLRQYELYDLLGDSTLWLWVGSFGHRLEYHKTLYDPL